MNSPSSTTLKIPEILANTATAPAKAEKIDKDATRRQQLESWLRQVFTDQEFQLESLPGDASSRQYHRLQLLDSSSSNDGHSTVMNYMVMDSADEQEAMRQFIEVNAIMAPAIKVPTLIAQELSQGFLILQDFGKIEFAHLLIEADSEQTNAHYQSAMNTLIELQKLPIVADKSSAQLPLYDTELLNREMDLFSDWFVPYIGVSLDKKIWESVKSTLIKAIMAQPQVIVHRDYHSRNLMQDQMDHKHLGVIDFQDAVIGAYSYDLVSLLRDAYVDWPESQVTKWISDFWHLQQQAGLTSADDADQLENDVNVIGVQRHLKVLGIFIRLSERDGKDRYLADIPKVMRDLLFELEWLSTNAEAADSDVRQAIRPFNAWLQESVLPAYQNKFSIK